MLSLTVVEGARKIPLEVLRSQRVAAVKEMIEEKVGIPVNRQRLLFNKQPLEDSTTLSAGGVEDGSTVNLALGLAEPRVGGGTGTGKSGFMTKMGGFRHNWLQRCANPVASVLVSCDCWLCWPQGS